MTTLSQLIDKLKKHRLLPQQIEELLQKSFVHVKMPHDEMTVFLEKDKDHLEIKAYRENSFLEIRGSVSENKITSIKTNIKISLFHVILVPFMDEDIEVEQYC